MDSENNLPRATVNQYIKDIMGDIKCSNDFMNTVGKLCKEYLRNLADESNDMCLKGGKKTITAEYMYQALNAFGLKDQVSELKIIHKEKKEEAEKKHEKKALFLSSNSFQQDQLNIQRQLIEQSVQEQMQNQVVLPLTGRKKKESISDEDEDYEN